MTPEAKQAAVEWISYRSDLRITDDVREGYAEGYDTATAKLRESVSQWMKNHDAVCKLYQAELSKREPLVAAINRLFALVDANHYERAKAVIDAALTGAEDQT